MSHAICQRCGKPGRESVANCCMIGFAAHCGVCKWDGPERDAVTQTVTDCTEHNRKLRHKMYSHGYAHVRVIHHHAQHAEVTT